MQYYSSLPGFDSNDNIFHISGLGCRVARWKSYYMKKKTLMCVYACINHLSGPCVEISDLLVAHATLAHF